MIDVSSTTCVRKPRGKRSADGHCLILLYHRVCTVVTDPLLLCVSPSHFAEQLEVLRREYHPISLTQLVAGIRDNAVPDRSVVLTFDDGYLDNLQYAKPLLERFNIPATVFVASGYVGADREFWWDELDRILMQPGDLPKSLRMRINGSLCEQFLGNDALDTDGAFDRRRAWNVEQDDLTAREGLFRRLQQTLRPLDEHHRLCALRDLIEWAGAAPQPRESHRALTADELTSLAIGNLIEIGGHTVTHPVLSTLPASVQRDEIVRGKTRLESIIGKPIASFSYPFGSRHDYAAATVRIVKRAGFRCACSNFSERATRRSDAYQLPRSIVRDWDGDEFARRLDECSAS